MLNAKPFSGKCDVRKKLRFKYKQLKYEVKKKQNKESKEVEMWYRIRQPEDFKKQ